MLMKKIWDGLCDYETGAADKKLSRVMFWLLLLIALIGWGIFLNFGDIPFDFHDWAEVNAPRLAFLKDAVTKGELPLHMPDSSALRGVTDRYMALPDMILSPQVLLLRWLSVGQFVMVDTWLMIIIGWFGMLRLRKRFSISWLNFTWIWLLFCFNGHNLTHYSVGHVTWGGNFLFGWFIGLIFELIDGERGWKWTAKMAFWLFFCFLQGSFHQFVWCVIFLGFMAISNWKMLWPILRTGIAAALLSAVRIIPPALQMDAFDDDFLGGFRLLSQIVNAFIRIISPADALNRAQTGSVLGWWEFDIFIGVSGVLMMIAAVLCWLASHKMEYGFRALICPIGVLILFSSNLYQIMRFFRIPLFSGERVCSRFLILPFTFLLVLGFAALQDRIRNHPRLNLLPALGLIPLCAELWRHMNTWKVTESVKSFPYTYTDLSIKVVANHEDPVYTTGLLIGFCVTVVSGVLLVVLAKREKAQ